MLAVRTEEGRPTALLDSFDLPAALRAVLAFPSIDRASERKPPGLALRSVEVVQRRAARSDCLREHVPDGSKELLRAFRGNPVGAPRRPDPGLKERLARIDVAAADDDFPREEHFLDGPRRFLQFREEPGRRDGFVPGLFPKTPERLLVIGIPLKPAEVAEAPRIGIAEHRIAEIDVDVVVPMGFGRRGRPDPPGAPCA